MNTQFTPGPWQSDMYGCITGGLNGLTSVCEVPVGRWFNNQVSASSAEVAKWCGQRHAESQANARLILATPELFEALKESLREMDSLQDNLKFNDCLAQKLARSVLAKASNPT